VTVDGEPTTTDPAIAVLEYADAAGNSDRFNALVDANGRFILDGVPPGPATLVLWDSAITKTHVAADMASVTKPESPCMAVEIIEGQPNSFEFNAELSHCISASFFFA